MKFLVHAIKAKRFTEMIKEYFANNEVYPNTKFKKIGHKFENDQRYRDIESHQEREYIFETLFKEKLNTMKKGFIDQNPEKKSIKLEMNDASYNIQTDQSIVDKKFAMLETEKNILDKNVDKDDKKENKERKERKERKGISKIKKYSSSRSSSSSSYSDKSKSLSSSSKSSRSRSRNPDRSTNQRRKKKSRNRSKSRSSSRSIHKKRSRKRSRSRSKSREKRRHHKESSNKKEIQELKNEKNPEKKKQYHFREKFDEKTGFLQMKKREATENFNVLLAEKIKSLDVIFS